VIAGLCGQVREGLNRGEDGACLHNPLFAEDYHARVGCLQLAWFEPSSVGSHLCTSVLFT
jgi:hypothetical protein